MTMTRQHFEMIAETINDMTLVNCTTKAEYDAANFHRANIARRFAAKLAKTNPNFDQARFLKACGLR